MARLAMGQGITGIAAQTRSTVVSPDVHRDPRFAWIRGVDQARFTSMVLGAARLGRAGHRRPQRPDRRAARVHAGQPRLPRDAGGPPRRARREEPAACRGQGPDRVAARHRRGAGQPRGRRHPRPADAARGRARLRRAAGRAGARERQARRRRPGSARPWPRSTASTRRSIRSSRACASCPRCRPSCVPVDLVSGRRRGHHRAAADAPLAHPRGDLPRPSRSWRWRRARCSIGSSATSSRTPRSTRRPAATSTSTAGARVTAPGSRSPTTARASRWPGASASSSRSCASTTRPAAPASASSRPVTWRARWAAS